VTHTTKNASRNNHRKREQASKQNGSYRIAAIPKQGAPVTLTTFKDIVALAERCIFLIARIRQNPGSNPPTSTAIAIGTGFIVAPHRMITAAHVLDNTAPNVGELTRHRPGDKYMFLRREQNGNAYWHSAKYTLGNDIFMYPAPKDLGVIHLPIHFYSPGNVEEQDFLQVSQEFCGLATPVGVLGYPLPDLRFDNNDLNKPLPGNVFPRVDQGIINTCYTMSDHTLRYEFTMAFNHGNSGGPIINLEDGKVISWVHGYKLIDTNLIEKDIPNTFTPREYTQKTYIESVQATYSVGIATASVLKELREHDIIS